MGVKVTAEAAAREATAGMDFGSVLAALPTYFLYAVAVAAALLLQAVIHHFTTRRPSVIYRPLGSSGAQGSRSQPKGRPMARPMGLRLLQINVWSGSKYQGELDPSSGFSFIFYEDKARREARYQGASANTTPRGIRVALVRPTSLHHRLFWFNTTLTPPPSPSPPAPPPSQSW